ncbi:TonB-dependent receptor domain-containing protein [Membranihabitans marinus]|uniref:TonB-dependent receptor domain-containing protein n=1 Tax=Membranihabitans marinus TaxID=1227546 RepID=UPI001F4746CB|nr:TonB-dependent receptor [Membranihabitans marinus]
MEALVRPYSAVPNQIQDFFRQGSNLNNSVYLSGAKGGFTYYASYSNVAQEGTMDNTSYDRNNFNLKASAKLTDRLSTDFGVNYSILELNTATEGYRPFEGLNAYANAIQAPVNIPYSEIRDYTSPFHDLNGFYGSYSINPYYILNEYKSEGKFNNLLANASVKYNILEGLDLVGRIGLNSVSRNVNESIPRYAYADQLVWGDDFELVSRGGRHNSPGEYSNLEGSNLNIDGSALLNYARNLTSNGRWTMDATVGYNIFNRTTRFVEGETVGGLVVPGWYHLSNSVQLAKSTEESTRYRLYGFYGNLSIGFDNAVFLEYSARNDKSSTLPVDNNSFFYQAIGGSIVMTDLLNMQPNKFLDFLKLRASIGTTGKDAGLYLLESTFLGNSTLQALNSGHSLTFPLNGQSGFTVSDVIGNPGLKPELTTTYEFGADIGFFDSRFNVEYTYYSSDHTDQIVEISLPSSSGFTSTTGNIGKMTNKGHELSLNIKPIDGMVKDLYWDVNLIYSKNTNEVVKISEDTDELTVGGPYTNAAVSIVAKEGYPFGTFKSTTVATTDDGRTIVGADGLPTLTSDEYYFDAYQPDWTASASTSLSYKGIGFNILFDYRKGGSFLSTTKDQLEFNGTATTTLLNDREPFVFPNSVFENEDGTYSPNEVEVTAQDIYAISGTTFGGNSLLVDATYLKLREIGLSYSLPKKLLANSPLTHAKVSLFVHNLKFWLPSENTYADPEINGPGLSGNAAGVETTQIPPSKSYGINLALKF